MKKSLIFFICLYCLCLSAYAGPLQENYEKENMKIDKPLDMIYLFNEDYQDSKNEKNTIYNEILQNSIFAKNVDKKYLDILKTNYLQVINNKEFNYIDIPDEDWKLLSDNTLNLINHYNFSYRAETYVVQKVKIEKAKDETKKEKFKKFVKNFIEDPSPVLIPLDVCSKCDEANLYMREKALNTSFMVLEDLNGESIEKIFLDIENTNAKAEKLYNNFKSSPDDMKNNDKFIEVIGTAKGQYNVYSKIIQTNLTNAYNIYTKSYEGQTSRWWDKNGRFYSSCKKPGIYTKEGYFSILNSIDNPMYRLDEKLKEVMTNYDMLADEVSKYSYNYEKQKYQNWMLKNGKKPLCTTSLSTFVYHPYAPQPSVGCIYPYLPQRDFTLQTFQSVPGGIILTGSYNIAVSAGGSTVNHIFLQTSKSFTDGQKILEPLYVEYRGTYDYTTVLGAKKRIYKFYRLGQKEYEANFKIPGQTLYFYQP